MANNASQFERPDYQSEVVQAYVDALGEDTYAGLFNRSGRAYPDVAALGDYFVIYLSGRAVHIGGTSASSPAFAGIVALLNDARLKAGLSPLGFLNPLIYSLNGYGFNDILNGTSTGTSLANRVLKLNADLLSSRLRHHRLQRHRGLGPGHRVRLPQLRCLEGLRRVVGLIY